MARSYAADGQRVDVPVLLQEGGSSLRFELAEMVAYRRELAGDEQRLIAGDASVTYRCRSLGGPPDFDGVAATAVPAPLERSLIEWNNARMAEAGVNPLGGPLK